MRVTRLGPTKPLLTLTGILSASESGPSGQVPTSNGSNEVAWGSNVANIWVNGTTKVLGPEVNIANGSNTTVTVDMVGSVASNTIRIHATGGAGSFGSNATRVSENSTVGASANSAREDHIHDGIGTITASSSNTMQRGTWNVRAGTGIALALSDTDGDGEFDTTTIVNTSGGGGGASSGVTHAYVGYNTIGGSNENAQQRIFLKKVTLANDCLVASVGVYIDQVTNNEIVSVNVGILSDVAGDPGILLAGAIGSTADNGAFLAESGGSSGTARWFHRPLGYWATAGDYWLAVNIRDNGTGTSHNVYYDGSGSDKTYLPSSFRMSDEGWTTTTTTSNKYSIRASTIR